MVHGRKKWTVILIAALAAALLAGMGYAAVHSGLIDLLRKDYGMEPAEGAEAIVLHDLGSATKNDVTMTVLEAAYAGRTLDVVVEFTGGKGRLRGGSTTDVTVTAEEVEFNSMYAGARSDGDKVLSLVTVVLDGDCPDRLNLTVRSPIGIEVSFAIDRTEADERQLISEKTVSDDGTLTVYSLEVSKSPLSQVVFLNFDYDLPAPRMGYRCEFLDAQGNTLDYNTGGGTGMATLPDGKQVFRQEKLIGRDAEIAAVRIYLSFTEERFGTVTVPTE